MVLSRSPSPPSDGSWSGGSLNWTTAKVRSAKMNGSSNPSGRGQGFLSKHFRRLSSSLPQFNGHVGRPYVDKDEKQQRPWTSRFGTLRNLSTVLMRQFSHVKGRLLLILAVVAAVVIFYGTPLHRVYRRTPWLGGGSKFVIILAANQGGGVMEWKGPREWAIERDSVRNKRHYAKKWGYGLEIVDMATKKRYAHEWRESWEKVDTMRRCMREYPEAEWFWWLDLNTFIMEPSKSLQSHLFDNLARNTYRDINIFNPLQIQHPPTAMYLDQISRSSVGDGKASSINMVLPQDCGGFNMGSFFMRRSAWADRLLDIWWDPVQYEQKHMDWEHKEQDAFEYLYRNQPWIRSHVAFVPQRMLSSFPPGACGDNNDTIHYQEKDRDFVVSMAGCEWGRDCWGEMYHYREVSNRLNRSLWQRFRQDWLFPAHQKFFGQNDEKED